MWTASHSQVGQTPLGGVIVLAALPHVGRLAQCSRTASRPCGCSSSPTECCCGRVV